LAPAGFVNDEVRLGGAVFGRYVPLSRCSADEHGASGSADLTHLIEEAADRVRTVGVLIAILRIARGLLNFYSRPVGVEFIGNDERQSSAAAAAHFGATRDDGHSSVGCD